VVAELDLSEIFARYNGAKGGYPPYHPTIVVCHEIVSLFS